MEEVVPKMMAGETQVQDDLEGDEKDSTESICSRCKKYSPCASFCISKRMNNDCDRVSKAGTFTADRTRESQLLWREREREYDRAKNCASLFVFRRYIGVSDFCYCWSKWTGEFI